MIVIDLPFPISVNAMFSDGLKRRVKSQRYDSWIVEAGYRLKCQRPNPVLGPVRLEYEFQEGQDKRKRDVGNLEKGVTDLLVAHEIIEADDGTIVREINLKWSRDVTGARVKIIPIGVQS